MKAMIGLETHVQLRTATKLFCGCTTVSREPNDNVCPICMGYPGSKPSLNRKAVELGTQIALALNCRVAPEMWFSRKSYFYPDLPKGFQITQYEVPLASGGLAEPVLCGRKAGIRIRRVHIEEDPAKLEHEGDIMTAARTLVDYARSGIPLCEIVTEPDFESPAQAREYLEWLLSLLAYLEVIDPRAEGVMRSDANISLDGGERVEIKNITGTLMVEQALKSELNRQIGFANLGKKVARETRLFDGATGRTVTLRKKEEEEDYGYIFEPDLPMVGMAGIAEGVGKAMREMPEAALARVERLGVPRGLAHAVVYTPGMLAYFDECSAGYGKPGELARWLANDFLKCMHWNGLEVRDSPKPELMAGLLGMIDSGEINERAAKDVIKEMFAKGKGAREVMGARADGKGESEEETVSGVIRDNGKAASDFKAGNARALQFLIGEVMKRSKARIDPKRAREMLVKQLNAGPG